MSVPSETPMQLVALAESILQQTRNISQYLKDHEHAEMTFDSVYSEPPNDPEFVQLQDSLKTSLEDLRFLADGPTRFYRSFFMTGYLLAAFQLVLDLRFFDLVPSDGAISFEELAEKAGLDADRTKRVVCYLATHHVFRVAQPGLVSHTAFSIAMRDEELRSVVHYSFDEMLKAAVETGTSLKATPYESDKTHCPFAARHGVPIFEYYAKHTDKALRFAKAMAAYRRSKAISPQHNIPPTLKYYGSLTINPEVENSTVELKDNFSWNRLEGTVVDIGGGSGHISMALARDFPNLKFVVQDDSEDMLSDGQRLLTPDIQDRIAFQKQSFFAPQPCRDVAAFVIRQCTHNWADDGVIVMFKSVVPGLEGSSPDTPLLINDIVMPEAGTIPRLKERAMREADMVMMVSFGAKQRTKAEFGVLLKKADPRFVIRKVHDTGALGLLEVHLDRS
ncbi:hypothetical protein H9Q70_008597 [Fusarium xylarioides]|nr:hypothetical protein H9Q70_008597 [Fusarium xylarioides]KAG5776906.1 hypothetical protein H9Q73_009435 [Fusarium xylarioides]